jgi:hypothetical protein
LVAVLGLSAVVAATMPVLPAAEAAVPTIQLHVLSGRADLVSGGNALVQVVLPAGAGALRVTASGRDVTSAFAVGPGAKLEGLVTGLHLGQNQIQATAHGARGAQLVLTDHPIGGPIFSGPQIQPWACETGSVDKQCNQATIYAYSYLPAGSQAVKAGASGVAAVSAFQSYDPKNSPPSAAIATTTTDTGTTVPFIVRSETGYMDRDQYTVATLFQPGQPWTPLRPQPQFNRKLILTHGASCDTTYGTGTAPAVLDPTLLGHGYVVASHALDNAGHNCNLATEAESLIMTKEHVVKSYGDLLWTIGSGCSGGSWSSNR